MGTRRRRRRKCACYDDGGSDGTDRPGGKRGRDPKNFVLSSLRRVHPPPHLPNVLKFSCHHDGDRLMLQSSRSILCTLGRPLLGPVPLFPSASRSLNFASLPPFSSSSSSSSLCPISCVLLFLLLPPFRLACPTPPYIPLLSLLPPSLGIEVGNLSSLSCSIVVKP